MNARIFARGTRLIIRRGQGCRRQCYRPHPERGFCNGFRPLITRSISAPPVIANSEASLFTATLLSAVNKDRCGLGTIDCALHSLRPPQLPSLAAGLLWLRSLRLQTISVNCPTPPLAFSEPSMPVRSVSLSNRPCAILSATFHPPTEEVAAYIPSPRHGSSHSQSATHAPRLLRRLPKPRCAVRRCTYSTSANSQPLMSTPRLPRHGGVGKLSNRKRILEIACRFVTLHDTPLCYERQVANAPLSVSPPLRATSSSPPIATFSPST